MHGVEIAGPCLVRRISFLPPGHQVFTVLIVFHDAGVYVAIGEKHGAVGQPGEKGGTAEVSFVASRNVGRAESEQQLFAVVREFVNSLALVVDHPDGFFGIVGIHEHGVRMLEEHVRQAS